jgi:hypothetical protein
VIRQSIDKGSGSFRFAWDKNQEGFLHFVTAVSRSETKCKVGRHSGRNDDAFRLDAKAGGFGNVVENRTLEQTNTFTQR